MPFSRHVGFMKWLGMSPLGCFKGGTNTETTVFCSSALNPEDGCVCSIVFRYRKIKLTDLQYLIEQQETR